MVIDATAAQLAFERGRIDGRFWFNVTFAAVNFLAAALRIALRGRST
jgi:hypothetical protein